MLLRRVGYLTAVLAGLLVRGAFGEDALERRPFIDPKADEALHRMSDLLAAAKQFSFEAHVMFDDVLDSGQKIQFSSLRKIKIRRPNKATSDVVGDADNEQIWYDGQTFSVLDRNRKLYSTIKVPDTIDKMMDFLFEKYHIAAPLADLIISDPYKSSVRNVRVGSYVGLHYVKGVKCHHLAFRQDNLDWQIWIEVGDKPLPRKLVITFRELTGQPQFVALIDQWDLDAKLPDEIFAFKAPEGAKQTELKPMLERREERPK
ncbi:MAG: DUF2092 domain-containing protein [Phycisphaerae bacterium]|nr:DUF2092 domain-containing protein [Phycisphaerae bacterium]